MGLKNSFFLHDLDKTLAVVGIIPSVLMAIQGIMSGRVLYLIVGGLIFISCLLWLAIRRSHTFEFHFPESRTLTSCYMICFFGLYTLSILSVYLRSNIYERPLLYFILTALMAGMIACEAITSDRRHAPLILIQILLLGVSIAWSQLLIFPSLLGVDPWYHSALTSRIINESIIPEGYAYSKLPIFHLMIAATSLITSFPYKLATMVSVSLGQIICNTVFVFLIANRLFKTHRVGLLAALMVVIANYHINMSYWSVPNAFAAAFIPVALYLFFFRFRGRSRSLSAVLWIVVLTTIILTHTISAMCMAVLLFVTWGALTTYHIYHPQAGNHASLLAPVGFTAAAFAWWTYASGSIKPLGKLLDWGFSVDVFVKTPAEFRDFAVVVPLGEQAFYNIGMYLFFAFSFIGIFYMISRRGSSSSFAIAWLGVTPVAITFFAIISGRSVIEHRWWYFAQILLSIALAVAIYTVGMWKSKKSLHLYSFVFGFVVVLCFLMIMSPQANVDNHIFSPNSSTRDTLTESELKSIMTLTDKWDGAIKSDYYLAGHPTIQYPQISAFCEEICSDDYLALENYMVFVREIIIGKPFKLFSNNYILEYDLNVKLDRLGFSRIYDSSSGSSYVNLTHHSI